MKTYRTSLALATLLAAVLLNMVGQAYGAIIHAASASLVDVTSAINLAAEGDTVVVPAGTASWASPLNITKGITLQGMTVISGDHGTSMRASDNTIILDNTPRTGTTFGIIQVSLSATQSFRLTGFTFQPGSSTTYAGGNGAIHLISHDSSPNVSMRVDHCHFKFLYQPKDIWVTGWVYGVSDHCIHDCLARTFSLLIWHDTYGGTSQANGNGSWTDYPWYGTNKFFFIEDNTINGSGTAATSGVIDSKVGGRFVARYNTWNNSQITAHGTEGGPQRGVRAAEVYNNTFNWTIPHGGGEFRSGTEIWHDNSWNGPENNFDVCSSLAIFREMTRDLPWGGANGANPWDVNDTEGDGTNVPGHPPHLYHSGQDTGSVNSAGKMTDSNATWGSKNWAGYSITNLRTGISSFITSNTATSINYVFYANANNNFFNRGDSYKIYKVLTALDQPGRGKGDQFTASSTPANSTGTAAWPHNAQEPCYSWNNIHVPTGHSLGLGSGQYPTNVANRDFYNLGSGFTANSIPSAVSGRYVASLNGVGFASEYVYPHPLVSNVPAPPTGLRIVFGP
jgi:hypothetical protein